MKEKKEGEGGTRMEDLELGYGCSQREERRREGREGKRGGKAHTHTHNARNKEKHHREVTLKKKIISQRKREL